MIIQIMRLSSSLKVAVGEKEVEVVEVVEEIKVVEKEKVDGGRGDDDASLRVGPKTKAGGERLSRREEEVGRVRRQLRNERDRIE